MQQPLINSTVLINGVEVNLCINVVNRTSHNLLTLNQLQSVHLGVVELLSTLVVKGGVDAKLTA